MKKTYMGFLGKIFLFLATIIWGSTFFIMEDAITNISIFWLLAIRFSIATIILALILIKRLKKIDKGYLLRGFLMGLFVIAAYIFQTYGLADEGTTPGKNAFLTATYCVIVPFLAWALNGPRPDRYNVCAAVMCVFGITLISVSGNDFKSVCMGDLLTLLGGLFYSFHMVSVSFFSKGRDILLLTMLQFFFAGIIAWVGALSLEKVPASLPPSTISSIIYLALMATCLCYILQNVGQKYTLPATSALILSFEAVFGVLFSVIFTSEIITPRILLGFIIVFSSVIVSEIKPKFLNTAKKI